MSAWKGLLTTGLLGLTTVTMASCGTSSTGGTQPSPDSGPSGSGGATSTPDAGGSGGQQQTGVDASTDAAPLVSTLCGNGQVDPGEQCDDGNAKSLDGCENNCRFTCSGTDDALCDDKNFCDGHETCSADHKCVPSAAPAPDGTQCGEINKCESGKCIQASADCGDGIVVPPEECDNGPSGNSPGCTDCRYTCLSTDPARNCPLSDICPGKAACNDATHTCVAGTPLKDLTDCPGGKCVAGTCTDKYCSNKVVDPGEECDDGNFFSGDGCDPNCKFSCVPGDATRSCTTTNPCLEAGACDPGKHACPALVPKPAGTACGTGNNCVQGNCIPPVCGDGILAAGIELCDDGNAINGDGCDADCTPSCGVATAATDCAGKLDPCGAASCPNGVCVSTPDTSSTASCTYGGSSTGTCSNGLCGTCGNGTTNAGEQCDDGNAVRGDGCDPDCTFSCTANADCDDGDPCDGTESCDTTAHKCKAGNVKIDGYSCGAGKVCISHSCRPSFCGDGYTNSATGEKCDPPNTATCDSQCKALVTCNMNGDWALKITEDVSWGGDALGLLEYGRGQILQWAKLTVAQTSRSFTATIRVCGLSIPDFKTTAALGSEWYGFTFGNSIFDATSMPAFGIQGTLSNLAPNASIDTSEVATLLGLTIANPPGPFATWPDTASAMFQPPWTIVDQDGDGRLGITVTAKKGTTPPGSLEPGAPYMDPIVDVDTNPQNPGRADKLDLVVRQTANLVGTLSTCTTMNGKATPPPIVDTHIIGCHMDTGPECTAAMYGTADAVRPLYKVVTDSGSAGAVFKAVKIADGGGCAAVRTALP